MVQEAMEALNEVLDEDWDELAHAFMNNVGFENAADDVRSNSSCHLEG